MNHRLLPFALVLALTAPVTHAATPITVGERLALPSRVLGEERALFISLPASYARTKQSYPVLYMTDGQAQFLHTLATTAFLARNGLMPEVIVVAVGNTDRTRDLSPSHDPKAATSGGALSQNPPDPLAAEIARETAVLKALPETDDTYKQIREGVGPVLARADEALRAGRRLLALQRLAPAFTDVAAAEYLRALPASTRAEQAAFEAEWARRGAELAAPRPGAAEGLKPAAVRAFAEAALPQAKVFYDASLEYGKNTMAESGFYYLGSARGQLAFVTFCRFLSEPATGTAPRLRSLAPDIDALEHELLVAYKPPASIDGHTEFILASSSLKEARELDAAGLRYGALLRLLQTALRLAPLAAAPAGDGEIAGKLETLRARLSADGADHTIARLFLEAAEGDLAAAAAKPGAATAIAAAVVSEVLPRYFAALGPAPRGQPRPDPVATITLVRWPYT